MIALVDIAISAKWSVTATKVKGDALVTESLLAPITTFPKAVGAEVSAEVIATFVAGTTKGARRAQIFLASLAGSHAFTAVVSMTKETFITLALFEFNAAVTDVFLARHAVRARLMVGFGISLENSTKAFITDVVEAQVARESSRSYLVAKGAELSRNMAHEIIVPGHEIFEPTA